MRANIEIRDATNSDWKLMIDQWVTKVRDEQRGAIFTSDPESSKNHDQGKKREEAKRLPSYWIKVLENLES